MDFVRIYTDHFEKYPEMMSINGRDAYAPIMAVTVGNEKYLYEMEKKLGLESSLA